MLITKSKCSDTNNKMPAGFVLSYSVSEGCSLCHKMAAFHLLNWRICQEMQERIISDLFSVLKIQNRDHVVPHVSNRFHFIERKWISILRPTMELTYLLCMEGVFFSIVYKFISHMSYTHNVLTKWYIGASWEVFNLLNSSVNLFYLKMHSAFS